MGRTAGPFIYRLVAENGVRLYSLHPHHQWITPAYVQEANEEGLAVYPWTIDNPDRMREAADAGVTGIISNYPRLLKETLTAW